MADLKILVDSFLMSKVQGGFTAICIAVAVIIIFTVAVTAIELRKQRSESDAERSAHDNGAVSGSDNTD